MSDLDTSDLSSESSLLSFKYRDFTVSWPKHPPGPEAFSINPIALEWAPGNIQSAVYRITQQYGPRFRDAVKSEPDDEKDSRTAEALYKLIMVMECLDIDLRKYHNDFFPMLRSWSASLQVSLIPSMEAFTTAEGGAGSTLKQWTKGPEPLVASEFDAARLRFIGATERAHFEHESEELTSFMSSNKYNNIEAPKDGIITYPHCPPFSAFSTKGMRADFTERMHNVADRVLAQGVALSGSIKAYGCRHIERTKTTENVALAIFLALRHLGEFWKILKAPTSFPVKRNRALYTWVCEMQRTLEEILQLPAMQERLLSERRLNETMSGESPAASSRRYYHVV
ncbi:MAG: hypothetical protein M1835_001320 [Candelina submexicana]|nr:MAG: hypothetical protein M1835_001320 [Candelina submexicana]